MHRPSYYIVNAITFYRLIAAFVMTLLVINHDFGLFKWMLVISFFTDAIDGYLARAYRVISKFGASLDSIADDLTVGVAIVGIVVYNPGFLIDEIILVFILISLYALQVIFALVRYRKITGFHTYTAKLAAILQGLFFISFFFLPAPIYILFYLTAIATILDLVEEIILVWMLPRWRANVKGLYWALKSKGSY
ncbi:CDP-alcohol phosphatidyltransferase family protein [Mucilaginibacter sp.]|uniref:CDP-alcohol phosphatidyltransferase family protein n=1 Tax=Mucilaginibacter sp. TaxID=1882438 RepID=UPI00283CDDD1|nr:CDP-alcohol phosphatidyltransferase family protein [Mucilaginibacter sp.]MDR3697553.1 CDP-alcohol phosphatidyltransferase family protein [Mucilaginibacter sp.]